MLMLDGLSLSADTSCHGRQGSQKTLTWGRLQLLWALLISSSFPSFSALLYLLSSTGDAPLFLALQLIPPLRFVTSPGKFSFNVLMLFFCCLA